MERHSQNRRSDSLCIGATVRGRVYVGFDEGQYAYLEIDQALEYVEILRDAIKIAQENKGDKNESNE
jgi:hypothetical protein